MPTTKTKSSRSAKPTAAKAPRRTSQWRSGTVKEFLQLSDEEARYIELRHQLAIVLRRHRDKAGKTQHEVARSVATSQSRLAKMESGDATVSLDRLFRALFRLGVSNAEIVRALRA